VRSLLPVAFVLLCGCGQGSESRRPGEVTQDEARAVMDAAGMLEQRRMSPEQLRKIPAVDTAPVQANDAQGAQGDAGR
jgi:hypothetical protein